MGGSVDSSGEADGFGTAAGGDVDEMAMARAANALHIEFQRPLVITPPPLWLVLVTRFGRALERVPWLQLALLGALMALVAGPQRTMETLYCLSPEAMKHSVEDWATTVRTMRVPPAPVAFTPWSSRSGGGGATTAFPGLHGAVEALAAGLEDGGAFSGGESVTVMDDGSTVTVNGTDWLGRDFRHTLRGAALSLHVRADSTATRLEALQAAVGQLRAAGPSDQVAALVDAALQLAYAAVDGNATALRASLHEVQQGWSGHAQALAHLQKEVAALQHGVVTLQAAANASTPAIAHMHTAIASLRHDKANASQVADVSATVAGVEARLAELVTRVATAEAVSSASVNASASASGVWQEVLATALNDTRVALGGLSHRVSQLETANATTVAAAGDLSAVVQAAVNETHARFTEVASRLAAAEATSNASVNAAANRVATATALWHGMLSTQRNESETHVLRAANASAHAALDALRAELAAAIEEAGAKATDAATAAAAAAAAAARTADASAPPPPPAVPHADFEKVRAGLRQVNASVAALQAQGRQLADAAGTAERVLEDAHTAAAVALHQVASLQRSLGLADPAVEELAGAYVASVADALGARAQPAATSGALHALHAALEGNRTAWSAVLAAAASAHGGTPATAADPGSTPTSATESAPHVRSAIQALALSDSVLAAVAAVTSALNRTGVTGLPQSDEYAAVSSIAHSTGAVQTGYGFEVAGSQALARLGDVVTLLNNALASFAADRVAMPDYALVSSGACVVDSLTSPTLQLAHARGVPPGAGPNGTLLGVARDAAVASYAAARGVSAQALSIVAAQSPAAALEVSTASVGRRGRAGRGRGGG
jgi:trimeric autotransporter adhesin